MADPSTASASPRAVSRRGSSGGARCDRLTSTELAMAGAFGGLATMCAAIAAIFPNASFAGNLAAVPIALLAARFRVRAVVASTAASALSVYVFGGLGAAAVVSFAALIGGIVGWVYRRGSGVGLVTLMGAVLGGIVGAAGVVGMLAFVQFRETTFAAVRGPIEGALDLTRAAGLTGTARVVEDVVAVGFAHWQVWVVLAWLIVIGPVAALTTWFIFRAVLVRLDWMDVTNRLEAGNADGDVASEPSTGPLPVRFREVSYRYQGGDTEALSGVTLGIDAAEFVVIAGPNGSGKSTIAALLAGAEPTSGRIERPGSVGLGQPGGTALITQQAETQILGMTPLDDMLWASPNPSDATYEHAEYLLGVVGLGSQMHVSTSSLSGGQKQRLALGTALMASPALIVSDESTAMIDTAGRHDMMNVLANLPRTLGVTVVHITHHPAEIERADRVIYVAHGRIAESYPEDGVAGCAVDPMSDVQAGVPGGGVADSGEPALRVKGLRHTFCFGTPWAHEAICGIDLDIHRGESVVITGENGSGKTTLAWLLAGLYRPTFGVVEASGTVALAVQHSRLQLEKATVGDDIIAAVGGKNVSEDFVAQALSSVGLDASLAQRSIEGLSGGQIKRVALAGIFASVPDVLILDEPLAGLDAQSRDALVKVLVDLRRQRGMTLVVVSHDVDELALLCDREIVVCGGRIDAECASPRDAVASPRLSWWQRLSRRPHLGEVFLRILPRQSAVRQMWAGSKILATVLAAVTFIVSPSWSVVVGLWVMVAVAMGGARMPVSAVPRFPWWVFAIFGATAILGGLGDGLSELLITILGAVALAGMTFVMAITTPIEQLGQVASVVVRPLRVFGAAGKLAAQEWPFVVLLTTRSIPLLVDEARVLVASRRLRARHVPRRSIAVHVRHPIRWVWHLSQVVIDVVTAMLAVAMRRGAELGRALTVRGGRATVACTHVRLTIADAGAAVLVIALVCVAAIV